MPSLSAARTRPSDAEHRDSTSNTHAPHPPRTPSRACQRASRGDNYHLLACSFVLSNALTLKVLSAAAAPPATNLSPPIDPTARIVVFFPAVKAISAPPD